MLDQEPQMSYEMQLIPFIIMYSGILTTQRCNKLSKWALNISKLFHNQIP